MSDKIVIDKMNLQEFNEDKQKTTNDGIKHDSYMKLTGTDTSNDVEIILTLKCESHQMPECYKDIIGTLCGKRSNDCKLIIMKISEQSKL